MVTEAVASLLPWPVRPKLQLTTLQRLPLKVRVTTHGSYESATQLGQHVGVTGMFGAGTTRCELRMPPRLAAGCNNGAPATLGAGMASSRLPVHQCRCVPLRTMTTSNYNTCTNALRLRLWH